MVSRSVKSRGGVEKGEKGGKPSGRRRRPEKINNVLEALCFEENDDFALTRACESLKTYAEHCPITIENLHNRAGCFLLKSRLWKRLPSCSLSDVRSITLVRERSQITSTSIWGSETYLPTPVNLA